MVKSPPVRSTYCDANPVPVMVSVFVDVLNVDILAFGAADPSMLPNLPVFTVRNSDTEDTLKSKATDPVGNRSGGGYIAGV